MKKLGLLIILLFVLAISNFAQTTLSAGDIAIVGYNFDDPDDFAFVTFVNLDAGTVIRFTDDGWLAAGGFRPNEGGIQYTAPTSIVAGTVIYFLSPIATPWSVNNTGLGSGGFSLATGGDQIIAFQGDATTPNIIYALNSDGTGWAADATSANNSALPTGLTNGFSAVSINEIDNAYYSGGPNPDLNALRLLIGDQTNWTGNDTTPFELETLLGVGLPVELTSFSATTIGKDVKLSWNTATEVNNYGFEIEKASSSTTPIWNKIGFVNGNGNSNSPKDYSFIDDKVVSGKYSYRLKQIDNDGQFEYSKVIEIDINGTKKFELTQNYPNPFNPTTNIQYAISSRQFVTLKVYDVLGNELKTLVSENKEAGNYSVNFNASNLPSGVYIYKLQAGEFTQTRKMTLLK